MKIDPKEPLFVFNIIQGWLDERSIVLTATNSSGDTLYSFNFSNYIYFDEFYTSCEEAEPIDRIRRILELFIDNTQIVETVSNYIANEYVEYDKSHLRNSLINA